MNATPDDLAQRIEQAQKRLNSRYAELAQDGGWRAVAAEVGENLRFVYELATKGMLPVNEVIRERLLSWDPGKEKPMNLKMQELRDLLEFHHQGRDRAISRRDLLEQIFGLEAAQDESNNNSFDREMRRMIQELNTEHGAMILPSQNGYFWASSLDEVLEATGPVERSARTQLVNVGHLKANARRKFGGQMRLGL